MNTAQFDNLIEATEVLYHGVDNKIHDTLRLNDRLGGIPFISLTREYKQAAIFASRWTRSHLRRKHPNPPLGAIFTVRLKDAKIVHLDHLPDIDKLRQIASNSDRTDHRGEEKRRKEGDAVVAKIAAEYDGIDYGPEGGSHLAEDEEVRIFNLAVVEVLDFHVLTVEEVLGLERDGVA